MKVQRKPTFYQAWVQVSTGEAVIPTDLHVAFVGDRCRSIPPNGN